MSGELTVPTSSPRPQLSTAQHGSSRPKLLPLQAGYEVLCECAAGRGGGAGDLLGLGSGTGPSPGVSCKRFCFQYGTFASHLETRRPKSKTRNFNAAVSCDLCQITDGSDIIMWCLGCSSNSLHRGEGISGKWRDPDNCNECRHCSDGREFKWLIQDGLIKLLGLTRV